MGIKTALRCSRCGSSGLVSQKIARRVGLKQVTVGNTRPRSEDRP
ncbi:MAG TPA: hypothetical protein VJ565_03130 [Dehalococcoidia bacterium]|nr:hypothetical protein [Dehalococcoidia bacterium]